MSDKIKGSKIEDCPPPGEKGASSKQGPIINQQEAVRRLQEAAGMPKELQIGVFGPKTTEWIREMGNMNDPEVVAKQSPQMQEALKGFRAAMGGEGKSDGYFLKPRADECIVDGSAAEGLLHDDGKGLLQSSTNEGPRARPPEQSEEIIAAPPARPVDRSQYDMNTFKAEKSSTPNATINDRIAKQEAEIMAKADKRDGYGEAYGTDDNKPAKPPVDPDMAAKMRQSLDAMALKTPQGEVLTLVDRGHQQGEIMSLGNADVKQGVPQSLGTMGRTQEQLTQPNNSAALDTSGFVGNVVHGVAGKLREMFFTADANTGAPLDNQDRAPAMAANMTAKPNPAAWTMSA